MIWQFWIDVGGTFTDYLAVAPNGVERCTKVLSSGFVKGTTDQINGSDRFDDQSRIGDGDGFWVGADVQFLDDRGEMIGHAGVKQFDSATGEFQLDGPVCSTFYESPGGLTSEPYSVAIRYELDSGLPAPVLAIHLMQAVPVNRLLVDCRVDLGTTRGTNALLTRSGARTALVTSFGMRDFLRIGDQTRPDLFARTVRKRDPLFEIAIEIDERVLWDGTVERKPDQRLVAQQLRELQQQGIESIAICLMFAFKYPQHERMVADVAAELGFQSVCCSSEVAPLVKIVSRGETTVLDAYLNPVIARYLDEVQSKLSPFSRLRFMTSAGGLVSRQRFSGKDSVLSGPAGGVVGAVRVAAQVGFQRVIGFDMGGTSTDVSRFNGSPDGMSKGDFERSYETQKAGVRIVTPMLEVETVAAGGGSVCWFDGTKLRVGPQSAGADPGPACYGRGGPLAITDINLFLGRFQPELFPFELDGVAVERRLNQLCSELEQAGHPYSPVKLAEGFLKIANHNMSAAIRTVSVGKGYDPADYLLMSFGGAGSQHCCGVADHLGMTQILDHSHSSVLSAVGIRLADQTAHAAESVMRLLNDHVLSELDSVFQRLVESATHSLVGDGNDATRVELTRSVDLRFMGTESSLSIERPASADAGYCRAEFFRQHQQQFGYVQQREIEIVNVRVAARVAGNRLNPLVLPEKFSPRSPDGMTSIWQAGRRLEATVFQRANLVPGDWLAGPAVIADQHSTTLVDAGWSGKVLSAGIVLLEKAKIGPKVEPVPGTDSLEANPTGPAGLGSEEVDLVRLEIFNRHFSSIARQMGVALQNTSISVNVKERLDFSCAIFTRAGDLVVNAPHIPVHLGAMSETVRSTIRMNPEVRAGDVFVTNDPYAGGSHLPDVTVVTPVFAPDNAKKIWFWVASRSHHAEIGGCAPGSMPAGASCLGEEGVLIQNFRLIEAAGMRNAELAKGRSEAGGRKETSEHFAELRKLLLGGRYPSRSPDENLADLRAQVAANQTGLMQLRRLVDQYSIETVTQYMEHIQAAAEQKSRTALRQLPDGEFQFEDSLDNGATIRVLLEKQDDSLSIDFSGTDGVLPDNLNANRAIVSAAVMYVMRLLIDEDIPLNEGVMKPVAIRLPVCLLNPQPAEDPLLSPAIVGGNVETSQRVVDVILGALGLAAASQGTMNNWLMGSPAFGYYETVGGGTGATETGPGADAIHSHMTNTRLTDPEVLESRYPVVLREFAIRCGSGGSGEQRGGDGMIREVEFRQPMTVSLLTSRRVTRPYGMAGGEPGAAGLNQLILGDGKKESLPSRCEIQVAVGDRLRLETPGGGGWG